MKNNFEMSMMGELKFFLGLQVHQSPRGIFISQSQYAIELLKKHGLDECVSMSTPMATERLDADLQGTPTDQTTYRRMIGGLMYLTASRPDIAFATFVCARYQARPTVKHLKEMRTMHDVKMNVKAHQEDCKFLVENSNLCVHNSWTMDTNTIRFRCTEIPVYCDSKSAIAISCNPVQHSKTKHIDIRAPENHVSTAEPVENLVHQDYSEKPSAFTYSFANVLNRNPNKKTVKIHELRNTETVDGASVAIPMEAVEAVRSHERVSWRMSAWLIRFSFPLILNIWTPNTDLKKDVITSAPLWVKLHHGPIVAYSEVGLSLIATQLGRNTYARILVEFSALEELKKSIVIAIPRGNGKGHSLATVDIEYEWSPPRCSRCMVFDHNSDKCPTLPKVVAPVNDTTDGFTEVKRKNSKDKQNQKNKKVEGVRLSKPALNLQYRRVEKGDTSKRNDQQVDNIVNPKKHVPKPHAANPPIFELNVSNSFGILEEKEDDNFYDDSRLNDDVLNVSDDEVDEEIEVGRDGNVTLNIPGASTPVNDVSND
ncbi:retrovirus-related pol polyprotein from transposon TNT 1-94 [Tanacetum coccineum]